MPALVKSHRIFGAVIHVGISIIVIKRCAVRMEAQVDNVGTSSCVAHDFSLLIELPHVFIQKSIADEALPQPK